MTLSSIFAGAAIDVYELSPRPVQEPLSNNATDTTCVQLRGITVCFGPPLSDGDLGTQDSYSSDAIHAWSRSQQTVNIVYLFSTSFTMTHVNLFYYHLPSLGGGLPNTMIYRENEVTSNLLDYTISGNADIVTGRNEVVLSIQTAHTGASQYIISFEFENTDVDWLFLSEVTFCSSPPADGKFPVFVAAY